MKPVGFVLWLSGAAELVGDQPPTAEQWAAIREKLGMVVGALAAARLLDRAEEALRIDEARKSLEEARVSQMQSLVNAAISGQTSRVFSDQQIEALLKMSRSLPRSGV